MFNPRVNRDAKKHALQCYPQESCGVVVDDQYVPCVNTHEDPLNNFRINPQTIDIDKVQSVIHSHPDDKILEPSINDMKGQLSWDIPWGVLTTNGEDTSDVLFWGDGIPLPELIGRAFRSGPTGTDGKGDCYALVRDYFMLNHNISIKEYPRDDSWWNTPTKVAAGDMYRENFRDAGFEVVEYEHDVKIGDIFLMKVNSTVPNHASIYMGSGLILHHLHGKCSRRDPLRIWKKTITHHIRCSALQ